MSYVRVNCYFSGESRICLLIHKFLLLFLEKDPAIDAKNEGSGLELAFIVMLRVGVLWR